MKLKYSPIVSKRTTRIEVVSEDAIRLDDALWEFAPAAVSWPDIAEQTGGAILEAHREDGELCLTILRRYTGARPQWDDGQYHPVITAEEQKLADALVADGVERSIAEESAKEASKSAKGTAL